MHDLDGKREFPSKKSPKVQIEIADYLKLKAVQINARMHFPTQDHKYKL